MYHHTRRQRGYHSLFAALQEVKEEVLDSKTIPSSLVLNILDPENGPAAGMPYQVKQIALATCHALTQQHRHAEFGECAAWAKAMQ